MNIGGLQKVTLIDYPGKIACTVFTSGCNFRCPFCYSKELVLPEEIKKHPLISEDDFFSFLDSKKGLLDGCVICGGEPTIYGNELVDFCKKIKEKGFLIKLDTNGSNPKVIKKLIPLIDYIAMDIKAPLDKYKEMTGLDCASKIKESIEIIKKSGVDYEFRTTITDHSIEDVLQMAEIISPAKRYCLQRFIDEKETISGKTFKFKEENFEIIKEKIKGLFDVFKIR
ncbi:MAG: anaerobic ribonucleoside-triphosphate reductase activating protein [Candidatus Pacebacteria bacterium]|nr:anaerobic ribonucleoside-triphosphate reductase activating protein [Candidatus Paceibacterota bacterium]MDD4074026.1 anaerobic ribonucleoside-triphosphate reductase activating protein [Candidatus Paceibacterota bacterium]